MSNAWIRTARQMPRSRPANRSTPVASRVEGPANGYREVTVNFEPPLAAVDSEEAQPLNCASAVPPAQPDRSCEQRIARLKRSFGVREYTR
jgi:hypothetical protein